MNINKRLKDIGLLTWLCILTTYAHASSFPESKRSLNELCNTLYSQKDYSKAQSCFTEQVKRNTNDYAALGNLALVQVKNGDYQGAIDTADVVIQQSNNVKQQASAAYNQGLAYERLKNTDAALAAYTKANQLFTTKARAESVQRLSLNVSAMKQGATPNNKETATKNVSQNTRVDKLTPRFKLSRNHLDNGLCEAFLAELNRTPWDELLSCKLPTLHNPAINELLFTAITGERIKAIDQRIYRGRKTWQQAWPNREKDYKQGYFRLGEAFFDANNDGKKEHVIRRLIPLQTCSPLNKGEGGDDVDVVSMMRDRTKKWESMTKNERISTAKTVGFESSYTVLEKDSKNGFLRAEGRILTYQGKIYPTYPSGMFLKNTRDTTNRTWFSIAEFSGRISSKRTYGATPVCSYALNNKNLKD